ncbi:SprT family zinc-dependent metalloprotease [Zophobihabitans entericus]|uniref:SprT family zinc-dependent metalloprotease n=1 Tax=Zophobihabitans entericus TaxID=1635327 RepID=A0A6G9IF10_9GAMM|nr:SprT family zinc-dependent metalloprotease [Zophobihabitans entericus]
MSRIHVPIRLQQQTLLSLRTHLAVANEKLNTDYPEPKVVYRKKGTIAGSAHLTDWLIQINSILLIENEQTFIDEVIPHELAHLLTFKHFGKVPPHGKEWKWMMNDILQINPQRTHNFSVRSVQKNTYEYRCPCQIHLLSTKRHNKILQTHIKYVCKNCGNLLQPIITNSETPL